jgi:hypothetical protein
MPDYLQMNKKIELLSKKNDNLSTHCVDVYHKLLIYPQQTKIDNSCLHKVENEKIGEVKQNKNRRLIRIVYCDGD